ncbi:MAG: hypothetical protein HOV80_14160 [Polyangiaceae bacterium]|nr:hypothetical protein [Polyangiaceae bacterium]
MRWSGDAEKVFPRRAIIVRHGKARFAPRAEPVLDPKAASEEGPVEMVALESGPDLVRVLYTWDELRLALYLEAQDLREVPVREVALDIALSDEPVDARLVLLPGAEIDFAGTRAGERKARLRRPGIDVGGWIKEGDIGRVFVPVEREPLPDTHSIRGATQVHTSPTGPAFGTLDSTVWRLRARVIGDVKNGRRKIAMRGPRFLIEGWVADSELVEEAAGFGGSGGRGYGWGGSNRIWLPAGAALFAGADGGQIGVVRKQSVMADRGERRNGRGRVGAHIPPWGWVDVWADEASFAEGKRKQEELSRRRARYKVVRATVTAGFSDPKPQLEAQHEDVLGCVDAVEKQGAEITGELRLVKLVNADGWSQKMTFSGPLSKNDALIACLQKELGFGIGPNKRSRPGTLDATIEIGKKPK